MDEWIKELKELRSRYGISQARLAIEAGMSREYLNKIENGKAQASDGLRECLEDALAKLNPESQIEMVIDYCRIRFPTMDAGHVIGDLLGLNMEYMLQMDYGFYSYSDHYLLGDIFVLTSPEEEKGILVEMKGRGCRQFEGYLEAQGRSWYDFFMDVFREDGIFKRLDLAINDRAGILNIPDLIKKCEAEECVSVFRNFKSYRSGGLIRSHEQHRDVMGSTLYVGSMKSEVYFCIYEKDYEQFVKTGQAIEEADVKNRFEIRLKNDRAKHAAYDLVTHQDAERTAYGIINRYMRIVDRVEGKDRSEWPLNYDWEWFIGRGRENLKLTSKPKPYTFERTLKWLSHQVAPTLKVIEELDERNDTNVIRDMLKNARLTEKHLKLIEQQAADVADLIV